MVSFNAQKFYILMKSHLSIFVVVVSAFDETSKRALPNSTSWGFLPKKFIILAMTFRSLIHLELIFVYGMTSGPNLFLFLRKSIFFQHCWKTPFHIEWSWRPPQKSFDHVWEGLFLGHWMFSQIKCYWIHGHDISFENPALEEPKVLTTWPLTEKVCQPLLTGSVKPAEVETYGKDFLGSQMD